MHFGNFFFQKKLRDYIEIIGVSLLSSLNSEDLAETWRTKTNVVGILQVFPVETSMRKMYWHLQNCNQLFLLHSYEGNSLDFGMT